MARIVAAFGSSHSIMLAAQREDWQFGFKMIDPANRFYYDKQGNKTDFAALMRAATPETEAMVSAERMGERFDLAQAAMDDLRRRIEQARLDVLLLVGDDQTELFKTTNNPAIAIYWGKTIRNAGAVLKDGDNWVQRARMWRQEPDGDVDYPVDAELARWLIEQLSARDFDIAAMDGLEPGQYEGHAFSFIHRRYLRGLGLPVVPVILNTFDPPNQPTPRRCVQLGTALRELVAAYPGDLRVGLLASGGLSHFVVDEELDLGVLEALQRKDVGWLGALAPKRLQAGSSEIRNWIVVGAAAVDLEVDAVHYIPGYRTPALTGTGLAFVAWNVKE